MSLGLHSIWQGVRWAGQAIVPYTDSSQSKRSAELESIEEIALLRFGDKAVARAKVIANGLIREISPALFSEDKRILLREKIEEAVFRVMGWATDKVERLVPNILQDDPHQAAEAVQKRREFGIRLARQVESFAKSCEVVSELVYEQRRLTMSSGSSFVEAFNLGVKAHDSLGVYADENRFYDALKEEVYEAVGRELEVAGIFNDKTKDMIEVLCSKQDLKRQVRKKLLLVEEIVTDPAFLKVLIGQLLDTCSESMKLYFHRYVEQLESPPSEDVLINVDPSYGKALMSLLRLVDPNLLNMRVSKFLEWFLGREKVLTGDDRLTRLVGQLTQIAIEKELQTDVKIWTSDVIRLIREKLFDGYDNYVERPGFISHEEWTKRRTIAKQRDELDNPESPLMKQLKKEYDRKVSNQFQDSCVRMAQAVSVASFVFEQHLLTPRQLAKSKSRSRVGRFFASVSDKLISMPVIRQIVELFHRFTIWIRVNVAKMVGYGVGVSMANRIHLFLSSDAPKLLYRKLLVSLFDDLEILKFDLDRAEKEPKEEISA